MRSDNISHVCIDNACGARCFRKPLGHPTCISACADIYKWVTHEKGILGSQDDYNARHRRLCQPPFRSKAVLQRFSGVISDRRVRRPRPCSASVPSSQHRYLTTRRDPDMLTIRRCFLITSSPHADAKCAEACDVQHLRNLGQPCPYLRWGIIH